MHEPRQVTTVDPAESDPRSFSTLLVGGVGAALLIVIILLLEVLYQRTVRSEQNRKVIDEQPLLLRQLQAEQLEQLSQYRWINQQEGVAAIPIDRAMALIVEEARARE